MCPSIYRLMAIREKQAAARENAGLLTFGAGNLGQAAFERTCDGEPVALDKHLLCCLPTCTLLSGQGTPPIN
jgi:hypothetical protein